MNRYAKRALFALAILIVLAIGIASLIAYFNEERIRNLTIGQLNKLLDTEVKVETIEFSLLQRFPNASIQFRAVEVFEKSNRKKKGRVLTAKSLFLEFDIFDLLTGTYIIDAIFLDGASLSIIYFTDGSNNFSFFKDGEKDERFRIELDNVQLHNSQILYIDYGIRNEVQLHLDDLLLSGQFQSKRFDLKASTNGFLKSIKMPSLTSNEHRRFNLDLVMNVDNEKELYTVKSADAFLDNLHFGLKGTYQDLEKGGKWYIKFATKKFELSEVAFLFSDSTRARLQRFEATGLIDLNGSINGISDYKNNPQMSFNFSLEKGRLAHLEYDYSMDSINLNGSFTNGEKRNLSTSEIVVDKVSFTGNYGETEASFALSDLNHPFLKLNLKTVIDLSSLSQVLRNDSIEELKGIAKIEMMAEIHLDSLNKITVTDIKGARAEGSFIIEGAKLKLKDSRYAFEDIFLSSRFGNNSILIDSMTYSIAGLSSKVSGELVNFLPFVFFENEIVLAKANLYYPNLDLNAFVPAESGDIEKTGFFLPISEYIILNLHLRAAKFAYKDFVANSVECEVTSKYPAFVAEKIRLSTMEGKMEGWMRFDLSASSINCISGLNLHHINIGELFRQFRNFGQSTIVAENLKGYAEVRIDFKSKFNREFEIDQNSVEAIAHVDITNGELIKYAPILALSKYIEVDELQHIRFSRLVNDIEIRDKMVFLPEMEIKSSAIELTMSGKHSFDNKIDYHFRLYLSDFLFRKAKRSKKKQEEFGEVEVDENGRAKLFVRMVGTTDEYEIKLDRKALRDKWKSDFSLEREELRELFQSEFGKERKEGGQAPEKFELEWEEFQTIKPDSSVVSSQDKKDSTRDVGKKKKPVKKLEDEYEEYDSKKFDD